MKIIACLLGLSITTKSYKQCEIARWTLWRELTRMDLEQVENLNIEAASIYIDIVILEARKIFS